MSCGFRCDELRGSMALHGAQVVASKKPCGFWVLTNSRSLEMLASDEASAQRLIGVLQDRRDE